LSGVVTSFDHVTWPTYLLEGPPASKGPDKRERPSSVHHSAGWLTTLDLAWLRADGGLVSNEDQRDEAVNGKESFERGCHQECRIEGAVKSKG
jgi:hypothetical protein